MCGFYSVVKISGGGVSGGEGPEEMGLFIIDELAGFFCHAQRVAGVSGSRVRVSQFDQSEVVEDGWLVWVEL